MPPNPQPRPPLRQLTRTFDPSRLHRQLLASTYQLLLPPIRRPLNQARPAGAGRLSAQLCQGG
jgi:hypothetical protein